MTGPGYADIMQPASFVEALLFLGGGLYMVAVVAALGMWGWSRYSLPNQPPSTQRGQQLHARLYEDNRSRRNLVFLTLTPLFLLAVAPGLLVIHPALTIALMLILLVLVARVFRELYWWVASIL